MKINKIDHIGVAVPDLENLKEIFSRLFDLPIHFEEEVREQMVKTIGFDINGSNLEFLEPSHENSAIQKFLDKRGTGIHHLALQVDKLEESLLELKNKGVRLIDEKPRIGAEGKRIAFIHPKSTGGILIELSEKLND